MAGWFDSVSAERGRFWAEQFLNSAIFVNSNHYDLPLCLYILYYRTGDPVFLDYARRVADKWWKGPHINSGGPVAGGDNPGPLYTGTLGLTLWALDTNQPLVWGFLDRVTREWTTVRLVNHVNDPNIYTDLREEGYILLSAVTLARVLPDSYQQITWDNALNTSTITITDGSTRRARYLADAENVAVNYFGRLQKSDGSWKWAAWNPEPALAAKIAIYGNSFEQPFMIGVYMEAAIKLHQLSTNPSVKANLQAQITKHCDHIMRDCYIRDVTSGVSTIPRVLLYFYPREFIFDPSASDRHLTTSVIHTFGYAYQITGNLTYRTFGDELWDSCFAVNPSDGFRSLMDQSNYIKLFTAEFRSSGRYLVWRQDSNQPLPVFSISGSITLSGAGLSGVSARLLRSTDRAILSQVTTGISGAYLLNAEQSSSVIVSPLKSGYEFTPSETLISTINSNRTQNFTAATSVTPSSSPTPTPFPEPSPSPQLLICKPNQRIGIPIACNCVTRVIGNPPRCKP